MSEQMDRIQRLPGLKSVDFNPGTGTYFIEFYPPYWMDAESVTVSRASFDRDMENLERFRKALQQQRQETQ